MGYCYNMSFQSFLRDTPFRVVYSQDLPALHSYEPSTGCVAVVDQLLKERDSFLADIRSRLVQA